MTDLVTNFAKATVSTGYDSAAVSVDLIAGHGAKFPVAAAATNTSWFNVVWYNSTDYPDPADDPSVEIVRVTNRSTDTLTIVRAQEGTTASNKNTAGKTYKMILAPTRKTILDLSIVEPAQFLITVQFANTPHRDTFVPFTVGSFMKYGNIKKITIRGSYTCGTIYNWNAIASSPTTGITPTAASFLFYGKTGTIIINDYITVDGEIMRVSGTTSTYITVLRGKKGTNPSYHEHSTTVQKLINGVRIELFTNERKKKSAQVLELSNAMIYSGVTSGSINAGGTVIRLTANPFNLDTNDFVLVQDTISETAIVQKAFGSVRGTFDKTIFVKGSLALHVSNKNVQKLIVYDVPAPYKGSSNTLYGNLYIDERVPPGTFGVTIGITCDKFGSIALS